MSKGLRQLVFWIHLPVGLTAGLVVLVMSATGVLLAYERQITSWVDRDYRTAPAGATAVRLPLTALLAKVRAAQPEGRPSAITLRSEVDATVAVGYGRERTLFVDPYSGEVLGEGSHGVRAFFQSVNGWHRWLALQGENRALGRGLTGAANLGFLLLVVSGVYLWWPRAWSVQALRAVTLFQPRLGGRARDFNWHNVFGFWSALPLVFIVASAVVMSYPWANDLLYRLTGNEPPPPRPADGPSERGASERRGAPLDLGAIDSLWATADARLPRWRSIALRLPPASGPLTLTIDTGEGGRPDQRTQLSLDLASGEVLRFEPFASQNLGRRLRSWARFVHTGEAGGVWGQTLAALASVGGVMLVWTGMALAWRRFAAWRRRHNDRTMSALDVAGVPANISGFLTTSDTDEPA